LTQVRWLGERLAIEAAAVGAAAKCASAREHAAAAVAAAAFEREGLGQAKAWAANIAVLATMSSTEGAVRLAICTNLAGCPMAVPGETVEWYSGAGEYCPECGQALTPRDQAPLPAAASSPAGESVLTLPTVVPDAPPLVTDVGNVTRHPRNAHFITPPRWFWIVAGAFIASAALVYTALRDLAFNRATSDVVVVCLIPSAQKLAADLVRGYAAKTGTSASRFDLTQARVCDVRFLLAPETPDAVIAGDDIVAIVNPLNTISRVSEKQLREIFSGSIRDWAQLGNRRGPIFPILPDTGSDEAKVLASSLFYGVAIDPGVRRIGTSADVTRLVAGADRTGHSAIGLVAFSRRAGAKVVPIVLSAASSHFPYRLTIGIEPRVGRSMSASGFIDYARSAEGAAIVRKNEFIPPKR
jgi:hypothetical protein